MIVAGAVCTQQSAREKSQQQGQARRQQAKTTMKDHGDRIPTPTINSTGGSCWAIFIASGYDQVISDVAQAREVDVALQMWISSCNLGNPKSYWNC